MFISSGATTWSSSIDGLVYVNDSTYEGTPITAIDAAKGKYFVIVKFEIATNEGYIGQGLIENASITASVDDISTYSISVKGHGDLIKL
jgi:predicted secreted protein